MVCVEVASDHNAFNTWHCGPDHVMDVRQELGNGDFAFLNILCSLGLFVPVRDQIALQMHRIDAEFRVRVSVLGK